MTDPTHVGATVELVHTTDAHTRLEPGARGRVVLIDGMGTVHVRWDDGSQLGLIPGEDDWRTLTSPDTWTVTRGDIDRCPVRSLNATHYHRDGMCRCPQREDISQ